jgi:manganese peroxidase
VSHPIPIVYHANSPQAHAVASCPGGPRVETFIGRKDAASPAPSGQLPTPTESAQGSISKFAAKGLSTTDLVALVGAHSTAKQFTVNPSKAGASEDSTPGIWDVLYYAQTIAKSAPFTFVSDSNLVAQSSTGALFKQFAGDKSAWDAAYASAMSRMELLGGNRGSMVDCTSALPNTLSAREAKARPINARA